jgi:hypothetical protein
MNRYEGLTCPVCHQKLFEEDDIAVCPICGCPHHRDCYNSEGHCHFEQAHGTPEQWQPPKAEEPKSEPKREQKSEPSFNPEPERGPQQNPFVFVGIDPNEDIGGEKAGDIIRFTGVNPMHYLNAFRKMAHGKTLSWNWLAFFFPDLWLYSRKCYLYGIIVSLIDILFQLPMLLIGMPLYYDELVNFAINMTPAEQLVLTISFIGIIAVRFLIGFAGDYLYKKTVYTKIKQIKSSGTTDSFALSRAGGVNFFAPVIAWFGSSLALNLILYILQILHLI